MSVFNIDGERVNITTRHLNNPLAGIVMEFIETNTPFILHDGDFHGPIFLPSKLSCFDRGEKLIHSGKEEFLFSVSFQMGLYSCVSQIDQEKVIYYQNKLLSSDRP